jgi:hypothetical protein
MHLPLIAKCRIFIVFYWAIGVSIINNMVCIFWIVCICFFSLCMFFITSFKGASRLTYIYFLDSLGRLIGRYHYCHKCLFFVVLVSNDSSDVCDFKYSVNTHVFETLSHFPCLMPYLCEDSPFLWLLILNSFYIIMFWGDFIYCGWRVIVVL